MEKGLACFAWYESTAQVEGKFYQTIVKLAMLFGTVCCAVKNQHQNKESQLFELK
ncbi:hypothetical protein MTR_4g125910 [Medicago truncatula]|uniref:Uncharacterized protein n=1 Tax=Medicago truncatula TaxID=3880 RepID=A0A072V2X9_MEDTR|nr:hypothetical protein MTR_4g125910 [Medicago truncatula]